MVLKKKYRKGANLERELLDKLCKAHGKSVISAGRNAGSKSKGKFKSDLWILTEDTLYVFQVKSKKTKIKIPAYPKEVEVVILTAWKEKRKWVYGFFK